MAILTPRWMMARITVKASPPKTAIIHTAPHGSRRKLSCPSAVGKVCSPKTRPNAETVRSEMRSMRARLRGLRGFADSIGSPGRTPLGALITRIGIKPGEDPVLHRPTEEVDLGRRRPTDFDVLDADAVEVFARCRVRDPQLSGDRFQRQPGGVEVQDVALAAPQLGLGEVAVGV